jgi:nucleoside-diphosphate-sugar epimerase
VAGTEPLTWNRYHEQVAEAIGAPPPRLVPIPTDLLAKSADRAWITAINFRYHNLIDNSAAERDLGFRVTVPFREGAARIYRTLERRGGIENSDDDPYDDRIIEAWERLSGRMIEELAGRRNHGQGG